ncbi:MAG: type II toxin-antitoxin system RelE/ParE family toxin [Pirellulales bacterium]
MSEFRIFETDQFRQRLLKLPTRDAERIQKKLEDQIYPQLREEPYFGRNIKKLRGYFPDTWRYRIGRFRMFYSIGSADHVVAILTVDLRRDAYR